ncbi:Ecm25 protein [Saccharomycopsis crataegensis]|uniref:Ecm25 protein n=1 Tax=Saccharomycopsis crataegensis TaxID=43959 RepID=A0AAV5QLH8_9ASCO|nr:Ecm25 protein [Saccharomycopsis crataegensis]
MSFDLNKILFKSATYDPSTKLPIYVFDTTALPNPAQCNFLALIGLLVDKIPDSNYVLVFFTAGLSNDKNLIDCQENNSDTFKFSWIWGVRTFQLIPPEKRKFLRKIYIIHESWWIRALTEVVKNLVSSKFLNREKIIHVSNLSELSKHLDITKINISLTNYCYEFFKIYNSENNLNKKSLLNIRKQEPSTPPKVVIPIHIPDIFGVAISPLSNQLSWYYYNLIFVKFLQLYYLPDYNIKSQQLHLILFHNNSPSLSFKSNILQDSISRNQLISLDQFELSTLFSTWRYFLKRLKNDYAMIPLGPVIMNKNKLVDFEQINDLTNRIFELNGYHELLNDIMNFFIVPMIIHDTNHLVKNSKGNNGNQIVDKYFTKICRFLMQFMCGILVNYSEDERQAGIKYVGKLIRYWPYLDVNYYRAPTNKPLPPTPRISANHCNLNISPLAPVENCELTRNLYDYIMHTNLISRNLEFLNDKVSINDKLRDQKHLNNFNILPKSDFEYQNLAQINTITFADLELLGDGKENEKPVEASYATEGTSFKSINDKIRSNFKTYFSNPLSDSNFASSVTSSAEISISKSFSSLGFKSAAPPPPEKKPQHQRAKTISSLAKEPKITPMAPPPPRLPPRSNSVTSSPVRSQNSNGSSDAVFKKPMIPLRSSSPGLKYASSQESLASVTSKRSMSSINNDIFSSPKSNSVYSAGWKPSTISLSSNPINSTPTLTKKPSITKVVRKATSQEFIIADKKKYAGIENGKVNKLAQLFEERLEGMEILAEIEAEKFFRRLV